MHYTREPIIETVITPKEGYKLIIKNSKRSSSEEYAVDAVEVVSFGHSFFFRSLERPKSFLLPVSDYEIVETKETRIVLKNANFERAIKIGGGKESKLTKEKPQTEEQEPAAVEQRLEKKRERRRHRRRRSATEEKKPEPEAIAPEVTPPKQVEQVSSSLLSRLIPPPPRLISEKIIKETSEKPKEEEPLPEMEKQKPKRRRKKKNSPKEEETPPESPPESETGEVQRIAVEPVETVTSTSFSTLEEESKFSFFGKIW